MIKPTSVLFGLKSVIRRKQKNLFAILAVALGVSVIAGIAITNDSLGAGFGTLFTLNLGERDGSVRYQNGFFNESIANEINNAILPIDDITATSNVLFLTTTTSTDEGLINIGTSLLGFEDSDSFGSLKSLANEIKFTSDLDAQQNQSYVGEALAKDLRLETGDSFSFSLSVGNFSITQRLIVNDIIKGEERGAEGDNLAIYMDLNQLQNIVGYQFALLGLPNKPITFISLKFSNSIKSLEQSELLLEEMKESIKNVPGLSHSNFIGGPDSLVFRADRIVTKEFGVTLAEGLSSILTIFGFIIILAGLLLIANVQLMTVEDRQQQTGIQRAIGTQRGQIIWANLTEFVLTGAIGGLFGVIGGAIYSKLLIIVFGNAFDFDGNLIPIQFSIDIFIISFLSGFFLSLLTGLLPAIRASRINIVETLRGVENKAESIERGTGMTGLYIGLILVLLGIMSLAGLNGQPWDFPNAYHVLEDAEAIFFATAFLLVGLSVLLSYFVSRDLALNIAGLLLVLLPIFHIFFVFDVVKEGGGGTNYILGLILSMIIGNIMLIGLNLSRVADGAQRLFSRTYAAVAMLSFRQMASQRTRSTLTFAIFAVILTLNIFMASWSYSDRYGSVNQVEAQSGGSDILILANQPLDSNSTNSYITGLQNKFPDITFAQSYSNAIELNVSLTGKNPKLEPTPDPDDVEEWDLNLFSINNQSFWAGNQDFIANDVKINLLLEPEKINGSHSYSVGYSEGFENDGETGDDARYDQSNIDENAKLWKALAENSYVDGKPMIVTFPIATLDFGPLVYVKEIGESIWLPLTNGSYKEFVLAAFTENNPLIDASLLAGPSFSLGITGAFINEEEGQDLTAFNPYPGINLLDQSNYFLVRGKEGVEVNSKENTKLALDIEAWSNGIEGDTFRNEQGKQFGMITSSIYELYEIQFDAQFRIFGFLQTFISFGFIVGVLGLLVVSVRSVQERKREIGMMRSIGLKQHEVIISIVLELSVMGIIGLAIGLFSGNVLAYGLVNINSGGTAPFLIPWDTLTFYTVLTLGAAFVAAIIPGSSAAKIPPSEALRYTG